MALEAIISADITDLKKKIKEAELNLQDFANEKAYSLKLGLDTTEVNKNIKSTKSALNEFKSTLKDTGASFQKDLTPKIANGSNALTQFGRIAQDAPFGIMGVGNNITATAESFGYLVKETGSAGGALKAVASSIMGTGGILLAVSLVTSALTYMSQSGVSVSDVFSKLSGTFDQNRKDMQDMNAEVAKNAQAQISSVGAYVSAAKNINLSMDERLIAVRKLQEEYPAYFGNLSKEQILNGNVAGAVREVTKALIEKAKAASYVDKIVKLAEAEENLQSSLKNEIIDIARAYKLTNKEASIYTKEVLNGADAFKLLEPFKNRAGFFDVAGAVASSNSIISLRDELFLNRKEQEKYTNDINKSTSAYIKLEAVKEKADKKIKEKKYKNPNPNFDSGNGFIPGGIVNPNLGLQTPDLGVDEAAINAAEKLKAGLALQKQAIIDFNKDVNSLTEGSLTRTFENLGTAIGTALAQGKNVFGAIGQSLLASLGAFLSEMGSLLIKYGTLAVAKGVIDKALTSGNPALSIGAGVAAIGVGIALKSAGGAIANKAGGSSSSASGNSYSSGASYNSPASSSSISGGGSSFGSGTVIFEIAGDKLIGVLSNTMDKNKRLGGLARI
jgi:hypothetical protein